MINVIFAPPPVEFLAPVLTFLAHGQINVDDRLHGNQAVRSPVLDGPAQTVNIGKKVGFK